MAKDDIKLGSHTIILSVLTVISRAFGFIRDVLIAKFFGASGYLDAFFVAFRIPNVLRSIVAEGALTSSFVPVLSSYKKNDSNASFNIALRSIMTFFLIISCLIVVMGIFFAPYFITFFAPGFIEKGDIFQLSISLLRIMFPFVVLISLISIANGALNVKGFFGASALAQILINISLITTAIFSSFYSTAFKTFILSYGFLIGGFLGLIAQIFFLRRKKIDFYPIVMFWHPAVKLVLKLIIPATASAAIYQLYILIQTILASFLKEGTISWLFYADRIAQLPIGVFTVSLASVLLVSLSDNQDEEMQEKFNKDLTKALSFTFFIITPLSMFYFLSAEPIIKIVFQRGAFLPLYTKMTSLALQGLSLGLVFTSCYSMLIRSFIAKRDTLTPAFLSFVGVVVFFISALLLMGEIKTLENVGIVGLIKRSQSFLYSIFPHFNLFHIGLCLSSSLASLVTFVLALILAVRRHKINLLPFINGANKSLIASLLTYFAVSSLPFSFNLVLIEIIFKFILFCFLFLSLSLALKSKESYAVFSYLSKVKKYF